MDEVAKQEIFIPLDMSLTCFNSIEKNKCAPTEITKDRGIVKGFSHDEKAYSLGSTVGSAGLFTVVKDLSHFVEMILNNGIYNGVEFLPKEIIDLWFMPLVIDEKNRKRSFSWIIGQNNIVINEDDNIISFDGFTGPSISVNRDNNIGIVMLTNRVHPTRYNKLLSTERQKISNKIYKEFNKQKSLHIKIITDQYYL